MDKDPSNVVDYSKNNLLEAPGQKKCPSHPIGFIMAVLIMGIVAYFVYSIINKENNLELFNLRIDDSRVIPTIQTNTGLPVDHTTYLQIQSSIQLKHLPKTEVIENTLRAFDIDGDGDQDILGFLRITHSLDTNYLFSTWHRNGSEYVYYPSSHYGFDLSQKYDDDLFCSIYDMLIDHVTLLCLNSKQEYLITLRYQKNGVGYYREVDAHVIEFINNANWPEYISLKAGISFNYPPDVKVTEKTYEIYNNLITIVTAKRNNQTIFEVKTAPDQPNGGGGIIPLAQKKTFLKLSDGTYLSRNWLGGESDSQEPGVFYDRAITYHVNNAGSIGELNNQINVNKGRSYVLFTPVASENNLKEVDIIFASIKYLATPALKDENTVFPKNNLISFAGSITLQAPGNITEHQPTDTSSTTLDAKNLEIRFIDSPIYQSATINLRLFPFDSVGETNYFGGGGYDISTNVCYDFKKENTTIPQKIGVNLTCRFGYGDIGFSSNGYYVLDPNRKYILAISLDINHEPFGREIISPDLKTVVESVKFTQ